MILALLLALQQPLVSWRVEPAEARIGQPVTCTLDVPHAPGAAPEDPPLELGVAWEVVGGPRRRPTAAGTRLDWTLLALEPGQLELPPIELALADGARLRVGPGTLSVLGELAEGEDAPRPLPGLRQVQERTSSVRPRHLGLALLLLALATTTFLFWRRTRRARPEDEPTELERFQGLERGPHATRPLAIELAALLRAAAERRAQLGARDGLTDEEWLALLRAEDALDEALRAELAALLGRCADVKFAGARPTRFSVDELLARGEALLRALAAPAPEEVRA